MTDLGRSADPSAAADPDVLVRVENVGKIFCRDLKSSLRYGLADSLRDVLPFAKSRRRTNGEISLRPAEFWANRHISFELRRGECLGLIGQNGAGKTTLLKVLNGLIKPDTGRVEMRGRIGALIALGAGFNPVLTGRENIYVNGAVLGLSSAQIDRKIDDIIEFADIGDFIDAPVQSYSSGMHVRLGFSIATTLDPDVLILDEVLAVGDTVFRGKCFARIGRMLRNAAVIFVSHNEAQISRLCNKALLLKSGQPVFYGETSEALKRYQEISSPKEQAPAQIVKDPNVTSIAVLTNTDVVEWGGHFDATLEIQIAAPLTAGVLYLHWSRNNEFIANSEMRFTATGGLELQPGANRLRVRVGPVHLVHGSYTLTLAIFDASCKNTIVHAFDIMTTRVSGPVGSGPSNLLPIGLELEPVTRV